MTLNPGRDGSKNYKNKLTKYFHLLSQKGFAKKKLEIVIEDPDGVGLVFLSGDPSAGYGCFKTIA